MSATVDQTKFKSYKATNDFEITFNNLTESAQKRLLSDNVDLFFYDAITSKYDSIRSLALDLKCHCESETLNAAIKELIINDKVGNGEIVLGILESPNLFLDLHLRKELSSSDIFIIKYWIASDNNTPCSLLNSMFLKEINNFVIYNITNLIDTIIINPNFKLYAESQKRLSKRFSSNIYKKIIGRVSTLK